MSGLATVGLAQIDRWRGELRNRYAGLSVRERALLGSACLALSGLIWDFSLNQPLATELQVQETKLVVADQQLRSARATAARLRAGAPDRALIDLRTAVAARARELRELDQHIRQRIDGFVPPAETERLLADVLVHHPGLQLLSAAVAPAAPLASRGGPATGATAATAATTAHDAPPTLLFRHSVRVELAGSYLDAQSYLSELEALPWGLAWDRVEYQVESYPNGRLVVELHTISEQEEWGGAQHESG